MANDYTWPLLVLSIVVVLGIIIVLSYNPSSEPGITGNVVNTLRGGEAQKNCKEIEVPYEEVEYYWEREPYTDRECEDNDLVYSVTNERWNDNSKCNKRSEVCYEKHWYGDTDCHEFCSDRLLSYSIDVNNLDEEQGTWTININFYENGKLYKEVPVTQFLYPKTTKTFVGSTRVTGVSPNDKANQDFSAGYSLEFIPTKQVCRDVTKYEDVERTRTVTKYKTETRCD